MPTGCYTGRTPWSNERIARLGFLIGLGWDAKRVAGDSAIATAPNNVHRQAQRFGLAFRDVKVARFSPDVAERLDVAAARRSITREALVHRIALAAGSDAALIENILDDADELSSRPEAPAPAGSRGSTSEEVRHVDQ